VVRGRRERSARQYGYDFDTRHRAGHENFVKILHADGVISAYSHPGTGGVLVNVGETVQAREAIGLSSEPMPRRWPGVGPVPLR
jgi:murein DD-endopeptidase MepM/ murein hydrolase activator NlpD